jgi:hypothetical protein
MAQLPEHQQGDYLIRGVVLGQENSQGAIILALSSETLQAPVPDAMPHLHLFEIRRGLFQLYRASEQNGRNILTEAVFQNTLSSALQGVYLYYLVISIIVLVIKIG